MLLKSSDYLSGVGRFKNDSNKKTSSSDQFHSRNLFDPGAEIEVKNRSPIHQPLAFDRIDDRVGRCRNHGIPAKCAAMFPC